MAIWTPRTEKECRVWAKDKEALLNVAYNVTGNISSRAILRHNNIFNSYLQALLYLLSTTPFMRGCERHQGSCLYHFKHLWYGAAAGFEPMTSRSESGRSTNWAIWAPNYEVPEKNLCYNSPSSYSQYTRQLHA